jgi:hypothetical protein
VYAETANEYLAAFQALNGSAAFANYSEFEVVRTQALTEVQVGSFDERERTRMEHVLRLLRTFESAYRASENESYRESLTAANETAAEIESLRGTGRESYVILSEIALERFYTDLGGNLSDRARNADRTPKRLQLLQYAATAYRRGGAINRYSDMRIRIDNLRAEFEDDLRRYNESMAASQRFVDGCGPGCASPVDAIRAQQLGVFAAYARAVEARDDASDTTDIASKHGLSERLGSARDVLGQTTTATVNFAIASAAIVISYALLVALFAVFFVRRILAWKRDVERSRVDEIVLVGGV